jgi:hypothetical protein
MDTPEMIWGRALAVHKPEIDFWDDDEGKQENGFLRILSVIPTILMIGPVLLVVVVATDGGSGDFHSQPVEEWDRRASFRISGPQIIDNIEIEGEDYDIYRWDTARRSSLSDLDGRAELQFSMVRGAHAGYHFSLNCVAFYQCSNDVEFAGKQWTQIQAHPYTWTLHTDWSNSSTFFVYTEEGEDMLLAVHDDVEVNNWASVHIEVRGYYD